jgi:hypothetical protein
LEFETTTGSSCIFAPVYREAFDIDQARKIKVMRASLFDAHTTAPTIGSPQRAIPSISAPMHLFRDAETEVPAAFSREDVERDIEEAFGTYDAEGQHVSWVEAEPSAIAVETAALEEAHRNKYAYNLADVTKAVPLQNSIIADRQAQFCGCGSFYGTVI